MSDAHTIAVIGGADGPTAVFVTSPFPLSLIAGAAVLLLAVVAVAVFLVRKNKS